MTPEEEKRAKAAANKRAYRLRKKQEELARQAPKEEQERLFNEQFRNLSPEEIQARQRDDHHAQLTLGEKCLLDRQLQTPTAEQREQAVQQILKAHPELEEQFRKAQGNSEIRPLPPGVLYQDHREQAQAILADAEERHRRVELIMSQYQKDACNTNKLLWHLLETFTLMRLELTDLIGSLRK